MFDPIQRRDLIPVNYSNDNLVFPYSNHGRINWHATDGLNHSGLFPDCLPGLTGLGWNAIHLTGVGEIAGGILAVTATGISFVITSPGAIPGPRLFGYFIDRSGTCTLSWCFPGLCMIFMVFLSIIQKKESILGRGMK
jgi:hypothetical protein